MEPTEDQESPPGVSVERASPGPILLSPTSVSNSALIPPSPLAAQLATDREDEYKQRGGATGAAARFRVRTRVVRKILEAGPATRAARGRPSDP